MKTLVILAGLVYFSFFLAVFLLSLPAAWEQLAYALSSGPEFAWETAYGGSAADKGSDIAGSGDGGFVVVGVTQEFPAALSDVYLLKIDGDGKLLWERKLGRKDKPESGAGVTPSGDGGFVVVGSAIRTIGLSFDVYVIRVDSNGNKTWERTYGSKRTTDFGVDVIRTSDGDFMVLGSNTSVDNRDIYLIRIDEEGNKIWEKTYQTPLWDSASDIEETEDGGFILAGGTTSPTGGEELLLLKVDAEGEILWRRTYEAELPGWALSITRVENGGFMVAGNRGSSVEGRDVHLLRVDSEGGKIWEKIYITPALESVTSIMGTEDGGFLISGSIFAEAASGWDVMVLKVDDGGNKAWEKVYQGEYTDIGYAVAKGATGEYVVAGYTESFGAGDTDVYLAKIRDPTVTRVRETTLLLSLVMMVAAPLLTWSILRARRASRTDRALEGRGG